MLMLCKYLTIPAVELLSQTAVELLSQTAVELVFQTVDYYLNVSELVQQLAQYSKKTSISFNEKDTLNIVLI